MPSLLRVLRSVSLLLLISCQGALCLRNVRLSIEPKVVEWRKNAILRCSYELEDVPLYSVKWYRGQHEFYRYTPADQPQTKIFPYGGIMVDVNHSNSTQVFLQNIEFNMSGEFSCEVTTDGQVLSTGTHTQTMLVVQLPEHPPRISVGTELLDYGDVLRANCSSPPSKPPAVLKFTLNNITVSRSEPISQRRSLEPAWSDLCLELHLAEFHFRRGRLILSCIAQVADVYQEEATLELDSARNPVPERVRASSGSATSNCFARLAVVVVLLVRILRR